MNRSLLTLVSLIIGAQFFINTQLSAKQAFMLGGWIPYWRCEDAVGCAQLQLDILTQISPFMEITETGQFRNSLKRQKKLWDTLFAQCKKKNPRFPIVPNIYWTDTEKMHKVFSNKTKREEHIQHIVTFVLEHHFDGININYERVCSHDRDDYLLFLKRLSHEMHSRGLLLFTSIGGRTSDSTIGVLHKNHKEKKKEPHPHTPLNKHALKHKKGSHVSLNPGSGEDAVRYKKTLVECCDQIHIMGYDEWGRPYKHDPEHKKNGYIMSHASNQWTEQIIQYALTFVPPHKLVLGVPTYGLEFALFHKKDDIEIKKRRNVTVPKAFELAKLHKQTPKRTAGGELCFMYRTASRELRYVCFLDAQAIQDKVELVKKYGIKGMYLFTINGNEDKRIWTLLKKELERS